MQDLDLRHLRVICTIADSGSLSKAAVTLGISQPALTAMLRRIEQRVGGVLFARGTHGVQPTDLGQFVLGGARAVLAEMDSLAEGTAQRLRDTSRIRVIGYSGPLLMAFAQLFGNPEVLAEDSTSAICQKVIEGYDFGLTIRFGSFAAPIPKALHAKQIIDEPAYIGLSVSDPLANSPQVLLTDLADSDWIVPPVLDDGEHLALFRACAEAGFTPRVKNQSPGSGMIREMVAAGGVALFQPLARRDDPRIIIRPLRDNPLRVQRHLVWRSGTPRAAEAYTAAVNAYLELLSALPADARADVQAGIRLGDDPASA